MHRFSIIVPMLGDHRLFDDTLASVLRYRPRDSQVIVVHDGTYEDPYGLKTEVDFLATEQRAQLIRFFNCAVRASTGELIALIRPGVELEEGWDLPVVSEFEDANVASVTPILVTPTSPNTIVAAGVKNGIGFRRQIVGTNSRIAPRTFRRINSIGPTSWAAFYRTAALEQVGSCDEQLDPHYLDLDLALSLKTLGYKNAVSQDCVINVERATLVERESVRPHGKSAQRAQRRHAARARSTPSLVQSTGVFMSELIVSPFQPWQFQHAIQRISARSMASIDVGFAEQLDIRARQLRRRDATEFPVSERSTGSKRRAA